MTKPENKAKRLARQRVLRALHRQDPELRAKENSIKREERNKRKALNPEKYRKQEQKYQLRHKYNISITEYEKMYAEVKGHCEICGNEEASLAVDHDHKTGEVRGLLCVWCNLGLGRFKDRPEVLLKAIDYLQRDAKKKLTVE